MQLSAVIITKNEEKHISDCLSSLSFCDERIVIDDASTDATVYIATQMGARVYKHRLNSDFAAQRNYGFSKANGKWVLFVDADEQVSKDLANEITQCVNDPILSYSGFMTRRQDVMWGKELHFGECGNIRLLRLVRKGSGKWQRAVHETYYTEEPIYNLKNTLMHYPHPTLAEFISDIDRMSTIHAKANRNEGKQSSLIKIIFFPIFKFIYNYVIKTGFRDGTHGFVAAMMMSFHSWLAWSKLWILQKNSKAM